MYLFENGNNEVRTEVHHQANQLQLQWGGKHDSFIALGHFFNSGACLKICNNEVERHTDSAVWWLMRNQRVFFFRSCGLKKINSYNFTEFQFL